MNSQPKPPTAPQPSATCPLGTFKWVCTAIMLGAAEVFGGVMAYLTQNNNWLIALSLIVGTVVILICLWKIPIRQVAALRTASTIKPDRSHELEDKARATLAQVFTGMFFLITAYLSWQGLEATKAGQRVQEDQADQSMQNAKFAQKQQFEIAQAGQRADRYAKAIEYLSATGKDNLTKRLGGIYALESIAKESSTDQGTVVEVLTSFVRQKSSVIPNKPRKEPPSDDVQAILMVLGRRNPDTRFERGPIDLNKTDLFAIRLMGASLTDAHLAAASLPSADLSSANLKGADLSNANLSNANLTNTNLYRAHLYKAHLTGANLAKTFLVSADLRGADLTGAKNLTQQQVSSANTNKDTRVDAPLTVGK